MRNPSASLSPRLQRRLRAVLAAAAAGLPLLDATAAGASETTSFVYDARGRLIAVVHNGGPNAGKTTSYTLDKADNRTAKTTSAPLPAFAVADASATEGGTLAFAVTKSSSAPGPLTVDYATANGSAAAGPDYTAASGTLTFAASDTTQTVNVATADDASSESSETLTLNLSNPASGSTISDAQGTGTIADNDAPPTPGFSVNDVSATEGGNLVFTVSRAGSTSSSAWVFYQTANGTATAPADYTAQFSTFLAFNPGEATKTVNVQTASDVIDESNETVLLNLTQASTTIVDGQGVGTILDDD